MLVFVFESFSFYFGIGIHILKFLGTKIYLCLLKKKLDQNIILFNFDKIYQLEFILFIFPIGYQPENMCIWDPNSYLSHTVYTVQCPVCSVTN